jgi:hypothetical protein
VSSTDQEIAASRATRVNGLRTNSFAAVVMLLVELGLGLGINLYANLPASDHGKGLFVAFGRAVTGGPLVLTLHAVLGTLLLITGISAVVRATLARRTPLIALAGIALVAILAAWASGAQFVGDMDNGRSLTMGLATGLAILCYATILFIASTTRS